jgi:hypothetical protein
MDISDVENVENSQVEVGVKSPALKSSVGKAMKSPASRAKSPRRGSSAKVMSVLDDLEDLQADLR